MADTLAASSVNSSGGSNTATFGPYWVSPLIGAMVYEDGASDVVIARTTNGGNLWLTTALDNSATTDIGVFFEKEQSSLNLGDKLYIAWFDSGGADTFKFATFDIGTNTKSSVVTIDFDPTTAGTSNYFSVAIGMTVSGNLIALLATGNENEAYKSIDDGATWSSISNGVFESLTQGPTIFLFPAKTADDNDIAAVYNSGGETVLKMYDDSADTWTETMISLDLATSSLTAFSDASMRLSDGHIICGGHTTYNNAVDDLKMFDINPTTIASVSVTELTNVFTNLDESTGCSILIDHLTDDIYVAYLTGPYGTDMSVVYKKSTDGGTTWGAAVAYTEDVSIDYQRISRSRGIFPSGGRLQWAVFDDVNTDLLVNLTNDIEFAAYALLSYTQEGYRFREDDGSETTANWTDAQDTNVGREKSTPIRLRILTDQTGGPLANEFTLEYKRTDEAVGEWRNVCVPAPAP